MNTATPTHKDLAAYLRSVIYELYVLAICVQQMKKDPRGRDDLTEACVNAGCMKLRSICKFFFHPNAQDSIKLKWFKKRYDPYIPNKQHVTGEPGFSVQSLETWVCHLDIGRATRKDKNGTPVAQPGARGIPRTVKTSVQMMKEARRFVQGILQHRDFVGLNKHGKRWWNRFEQTLSQLEDGDR